MTGRVKVTSPNKDKTVVRMLARTRVETEHLVIVSTTLIDRCRSFSTPVKLGIEVRPSIALAVELEASLTDVGCEFKSKFEWM